MIQFLTAVITAIMMPVVLFHCSQSANTRLTSTDRQTDRQTLTHINGKQKVMKLIEMHIYMQVGTYMFVCVRVLSL